VFAILEVSIIAGIKAALLAMPEPVELLGSGVVLFVLAIVVRRLFKRLENTKHTDGTAKKAQARG